MCEFVSTVKKGRKEYFLTHDLIYNTEKGKELQAFCENPDDYCGHGAIRWYFGLERDEGENKEYTDFTTPENFPTQIVKAIKNGEMRGVGIARGSLTTEAIGDYEAKRKPLDDDYYAKYKLLCDDYHAKRKPLDDDYCAKRNDLFWDLFAIPENRNPAWR